MRATTSAYSEVIIFQVGRELAKEHYNMVRNEI